MSRTRTASRVEPSTACAIVREHNAARPYTRGVVFGTTVSKWVALLALVALLWVARGVLPPFIVAGILAYILSPLVDEIAGRTGWRRAYAAVLVFLAVVAIVAV